ncbi:MAG: hypothetical protein IJ535_09950 [Pseudobutyrivibrio sp.]|uniref:hypothetical protein n=1 Tax=Pseudobutyrivibrio sp. TaxID=2014367 RepID=UPI0025EF3DC6|nr:hypothetical protein [Pseudobutyrivibrio sp.]MBQ8490088.1 hypothetical protein [Pseudobutyrivibrio sp.]
MENSIFRKKTMDRISSPEQLTDYLKVTNPSIWLVLFIVLLILVGFIAWASVGKLTTTVDGSAIIAEGEASIVVTRDENNASNIEAGTKVEIAGQEYVISSVDTDAFGRTVAHARIPLADGKYDASIVVEEIKPIQFLFEGR